MDQSLYDEKMRRTWSSCDRRRGASSHPLRQQPSFPPGFLYGRRQPHRRAIQTKRWKRPQQWRVRFFSAVRRVCLSCCMVILLYDVMRSFASPVEQREVVQHQVYTANPVSSRVRIDGDEGHRLDVVSGGRILAAALVIQAPDSVTFLDFFPSIAAP